MSKLAATWHDVDLTKTHHEFETVAGAEAWLSSVLDCCDGEEFEAWAEESGYSTDGLGKLVFYTDEGWDEVGDITFYRDGIELSPHDLCELAREERTG